MNDAQKKSSPSLYPPSVTASPITLLRASLIHLFFFLRLTKIIFTHFSVLSNLLCQPPKSAKKKSKNRNRLSRRILDKIEKIKLCKEAWTNDWFVWSLMKNTFRLVRRLLRIINSLLINLKSTESVSDLVSGR